jgi:rhamnosyltransferase
VLPVKNAGPDLPELLAALRGQYWGGAAELIAIDSGSRDGSVETLRDFGATVLAIDPAAFDHGLTRMAAARHARGQVVVFLTQSMRPNDGHWLRPLVEALDADHQLAGVSSRLIPHLDANPLERFDVMRELSYSTHRNRRSITDRESFRSLEARERRALAHFHTVSCAVRPEVLKRTPFRSVTTIGEDLQWGMEALEAGMALAHEPDSVARHSHDYGLEALLQRNFDDGVAAHELAGLRITGDSLIGHIDAQVAKDMEHLRAEYEMEPEELTRWERESVSRRTAQLVGQCLGTHADRLPGAAIDALSLVRRVMAEPPQAAQVGYRDRPAGDEQRHPGEQEARVGVRDGDAADQHGQRHPDEEERLAPVARPHPPSDEPHGG